MAMLDKVLLRFAARLNGLQCSYKNVNKEIVWSKDEALIKVLETLTNQKIINNDDLVKICSQKKESQFLDKVKSVHVFWDGLLSKIIICSKEVPALKKEAEICYEDGTKEKIILQLIDSRKLEFGFKASYQMIKKIDVGYHKLKLQIDNIEVETFLVCPPKSLPINDVKEWGPFVPMYALRSDSDWGIGSFKEAKELAIILKKYGASWMGLLPMLAGNFDYDDCDPSPYSSLSRLFWNEIYLDIEALVLKYNSKKAGVLISDVEFKNKIKELRETEFVDYRKVYLLKKEVLQILANEFFENKLDQKNEYIAFVKENPEVLKYVKFRGKETPDQQFHLFVQFEMNESLKAFYNETGVGLYMDYPVGVNDSGFDYKEYRSVFFGEVSVGAPPEPVFALGQDWGFPAFSPEGMRKDRYHYFRRSLQHHLKFGKIMRLDHIMGLYRIYSVPKGFKGDEGIYLRFSPDELFAVVILEAYRAGADLIGENLGTVPLFVDEMISKRNLNGMWVFECETWRGPREAFSQIKANQLVCLNTHDMPMLETYKEGSDLDLVYKLGILSEKYKKQFQLERESQMRNWKEVLGNETFNYNLIKNIAKSDARFFVLNLEDLWGEGRPQNIPGTWKEYPNWRKKFTLKVSEILNNKNATNSLEVLKEQRSKK